MDLDVDMCLEARAPDRVVVRLRLLPWRGAVTVDGAALELLSAAGEAICPRLLLPFSGELGGEVYTRVELRAGAALPEGAQVQATVWRGAEQVTAIVPADPWVGLREHLTGSNLARFDPAEVLLEPLSADELEYLAEQLPWLADPRPDGHAVEVIEAASVDVDATVGELAEELGVDEADAAWLKDLLEEEA